MSARRHIKTDSVSSMFLCLWSRDLKTMEKQSVCDVMKKEGKVVGPDYTHISHICISHMYIYIYTWIYIYIYICMFICILYTYVNVCMLRMPLYMYVTCVTYHQNGRIPNPDPIRVGHSSTRETT